ncbi:MAG: polysaccharide deacetylase family protein [Pigmentiphaga sp.]|nr:polysaccharide deacetylase family protein [Pigmentiphaga sp.]
MAVRNRRPIPILMYHQIDAPPPRGTPFRGLTVAPQVFARHMRWLRALGYRGLSMRDLRPYLAGERQGRVVGITFDDGFASAQRHVLPILRETGFTATNYLVAGHAGQTNFWDAANGVPPMALMTEAQIAEWAAAGHEVGSHTMDHADLSTLEPDAAREQIATSRQRLEALTGERVTAFCYPYGHFKPEHAEMAREAGYLDATTTARGRVHAGADPWRLPRVPVVRSTHFLALLQKLATPYEDRRSGR